MCKEDLVYISIDCEATGLKIKNIDILELGAVIDVIPANPKNHKWTPLNELPTFQTYFLPPNDGVFKGEPGGLAMNANILAKIDKKDEIIKANSEMRKHFNHPNKFGHRLKTWMKDSGYHFHKEGDKLNTFVAGKNFDRFDRQLLLEKTDFAKHVGFRGMAFDPGVLFFTPGKHKKIPSLPECKQMAGVKGIVTHKALDDAFDVVECLRWYYGEWYSGE